MKPGDASLLLVSGHAERKPTSSTPESNHVNLLEVKDAATALLRNQLIISHCMLESDDGSGTLFASSVLIMFTDMNSAQDCALFLPNHGGSHELIPHQEQ